MALSLCDKFKKTCKKEGYHAVRRANDVQKGKINALLTIEEGGALEGKLSNLTAIYRRGVRMMGLTWNYSNEIGGACYANYERVEKGEISASLRNQEGGLTQFGREVVAKMNELGMIIDVSHASDKLVSDVLFYSTQPIVASHSNAQSVCDCARNLFDWQIKEIARGGGIVALNFCADFLSRDNTEEGQKEAILAHVKAIYRAGGEDCLAIGSDFDGIVPNAYIPAPNVAQKLLDEVTKEYGSSVCEKVASKNFLRVFQTVCG